MKFILTFILALSLTKATSQKHNATTTNDLVRECMRIDGDVTNKKMAIWFPYLFWEIVGEQIKASPEFVENIVNQMKDYMMFCVVDYATTSSGIKFKTDDEIRKTIVLTDSSKNIIKPLEDREISADVKKLLLNFKPAMSQMLGQFGEGMRVYLFKPKQVSGQPAFNILFKNNFTLSWNTTNLNWQLPLSTALPPKFCPIDNEKMKGNWHYCPIHGVKL